tara:strand:+ start:67 stop:426 length:360 start_codon:yes stop_codon:yes gene_type:complete
MKKIVYICILFLISCSSDEKISVELKPDITEVITNTNSIDGIVYASCGVCNFGSKESYECFLAIKVEDTVFPVEGSDIDDHGDAHAEEGLCNVIHHAEVSGEFKNNVFYAESFNLVNIN